MATFQTQATDKNGKVLLGKLRSVSTQDGFDTALCTSALGLACLGGGGCDVCCTAIFCPCFLFGSNVKILRSGSYQSPCVDVTGCKRSAPCVNFLVPYTCIAMAGYTFLPIGPLAFCPLAMFTASYRHLIRKGAHSCVSQIQSVYSTLCDYTSFIQRKYFLLLVTFTSTRGSYKYITSALFPASGRLHIHITKYTHTRRLATDPFFLFYPPQSSASPHPASAFPVFQTTSACTSFVSPSRFARSTLSCARIFRSRR